MKARLIINEIKQDLPNGLSGIGIGASTLTKGYNHLNKIDRVSKELVRNDADNIDYYIRNDAEINRHIAHNITKEMSFLLECSKDEIAVINNHKIPVEVSEWLISKIYGEDHINRDNQFNFEKQYADVRISFSPKWQIGKIFIDSKNIEQPNVISSSAYYFMRYK